MIRNPSYKRLCAAFAILSVLLSAGAALLRPAAGILVLAGCFLLFLPVRWFVRRQFDAVRVLSQYLERICAGEYELDIRDNEEGELSILKNDIYKVTLTLREQAELLKKEKILLAEAISDISHQLKTPLTSMVVMTDLLCSPDISEEKRREFTQNILSQLERMEWLLTSLLKLSKIDAGAIRFRQEPVPVAELLRRAAAPLLVPMDIKNQTLRVECGEAVSFMGDMQWSAEALVNILKNCVEHTPEGGCITIRASQNHIYTLLLVEDTGMGIDPDDLPHVFERFYKGKNSGADSVGIGLAMAKSIFNSQNGTIEVASRQGIGTSFQVKLYQKVV